VETLENLSTSGDKRSASCFLTHVVCHYVFFHNETTPNLPYDVFKMLKMFSIILENVLQHFVSRVTRS